jgi:hypothetical protein
MKTQDELVEKLKTNIHNEYTIGSGHLAERINVRVQTLVWALGAKYMRYLPTKQTAVVYDQHAREWGHTVDLFVINYDTTALTVSFVDIKDCPGDDVEWDY